eukprot:jgi/Mesvir1/17917/Mv12980-RA.1
MASVSLAPAMLGPDAVRDKCAALAERIKEVTARYRSFEAVLCRVETLRSDAIDHSLLAIDQNDDSMNWANSSIPIQQQIGGPFAHIVKPVISPGLQPSRNARRSSGGHQGHGHSHTHTLSSVMTDISSAAPATHNSFSGPIITGPAIKTVEEENSTEGGAPWAPAGRDPDRDAGAVDAHAEFQEAKWTEVTITSPLLMCRDAGVAPTAVESAQLMLHTRQALDDPSYRLAMPDPFSDAHMREQRMREAALAPSPEVRESVRRVNMWFDVSFLWPAGGAYEGVVPEWELDPALKGTPVSGPPDKVWFVDPATGDDPNGNNAGVYQGVLGQPMRASPGPSNLQPRGMQPAVGTVGYTRQHPLHPFGLVKEAV